MFILFICNSFSTLKLIYYSHRSVSFKNDPFIIPYFAKIDNYSYENNYEMSETQMPNIQYAPLNHPSMESRIRATIATLKSYSSMMMNSVVYNYL